MTINRSMALLERFQKTRTLSLTLCEPLAIEDYGLQAVVETSPLKWHLAHTTWFFETFVLKPYQKDFQPFHSAFEALFNSYYNSVGEQFPRGSRHLLSRPTVDEVCQYRRHVDRQLSELLESPNISQEALDRIELGLHHEQQHQELMLTDLKYNFAQNPLYPVYRKSQSPACNAVIPLKFLSFPGGLREVGQNRDEGFAFDNETPQHPVLVQPFEIACRLVTNGEYLEFMEDGGYSRPEFWLADGWTQLQARKWQHPLHWRLQGSEYMEFTLHGLQPLAPHLPVTHISYYEADAYARWRGARLCTEFEWETAARTHPPRTETFNPEWLHPAPPAAETTDLKQMFGDAWEWTQSAYLPYPGYQADRGALGEYNGKFMCNQMVLRGGSCATPSGHIRPSYRNFFYPQDRWQFTGIRLARDLQP